MYKVLVSEQQLFDNNLRVYDVIKFFAERCDLKTSTADMLIYKNFGNETISVINKEVYDQLIKDEVSFSDYATDYMIRDYPFLHEEDVDKYFESHVCEQDMPVLGTDGIPKYVVLKGYKGKDNCYICKVLSGISDYNLSVNADMTVSCNCKLREAGQLGNLKNESFFDIYNSEHVSNVRKRLFEGFLPTASCRFRCRELMQVPVSVGKYYLENYTVPKIIMFENTSICNLRCRGCFNAYIDNSIASIDDVNNLSEKMREEGIKKVNLFKYGETFSDKELKTKVQIIREKNPDIIIDVSTNGMLLDREYAFESALMMNLITFSLDGVDDETLSEFQTGAVFSQIYQNMKNLVTERNRRGLKSPAVRWKYVLFNHNQSDEYINKAFRLADEAGVDYLDFVVGFNEEKPSNAINESDVFYDWMKKYKFRYNTNMLSFSIR